MTDETAFTSGNLCSCKHQKGNHEEFIFNEASGFSGEWVDTMCKVAECFCHRFKAMSNFQYIEWHHQNEEPL